MQVESEGWMVVVHAGEPEAGSPNYSDEDAELVRTRVQENCATWLVQVDDHGWLKVVCLVKVESASEAGDGCQGPHLDGAVSPQEAAAQLPKLAGRPDARRRQRSHS